MSTSMTLAEKIRPSLMKLPGYLIVNSGIRRHTWQIPVNKHNGIYATYELRFEVPSLYLSACARNEGQYYIAGDTAFHALPKEVVEQFRIAASALIVAIKEITEPLGMTLEVKPSVIWKDNVHQ